MEGDVRFEGNLLEARVELGSPEGSRGCHLEGGERWVKLQAAVAGGASTQGWGRPRAERGYLVMVSGVSSREHVGASATGAGAPGGAE
jgi:hypothetical protein